MSLRWAKRIIKEGLCTWQAIDGFVQPHVGQAFLPAMMATCVMVQGPRVMPKITFVKDKLEIEVPQGANLRDEAMKAGVEVYVGVNRYLNCLGHGTCGTCKVVVKKGAENLSPKTAMEKFTLWRMLSVI